MKSYPDTKYKKEAQEFYETIQEELKLPEEADSK